MICATGYTLLLKKLTERYHPFFLTAMQAFAGALFYLPVMVLTARPLPVEFVPVPALSVVYLGIAVTMGAYGLYNFGVSRIPASQASAFVNLIPVFTVILGWMVLARALPRSSIQRPCSSSQSVPEPARPGDSPVSTDVDQKEGICAPVGVPLRLRWNDPGRAGCAAGSEPHHLVCPGGKDHCPG